jgi:DNA repair exonuclease SbcCD nuclease subunit
MKFLKVGDPHLTPSGIPEMTRLMEFVETQAEIRRVDAVILYGDLFHTHIQIRMDVMVAWYGIIDKLLQTTNVIIITGNHDQPGAKELEDKMSSVQILERMFRLDENDHWLDVVSKPKVIGNVAFAPYTSDPDKFYAWANELHAQGATQTLCCHQTFEGSKYDNGMYAPSGLDPDKVPQTGIISGHIHTHQEFGKVFYIGTPKWETAVDADKEKGIWYAESDEQGQIDMGQAEFISTAQVVTPMRRVPLKEGDAEPVLDDRSKYLIELTGSSAWISKEKKKYVEKHAIKTIFTDSKIRAKRKTSNFDSIGDFLEKEFVPSEGVSREKLVEYVQGSK